MGVGLVLFLVVFVLTVLLPFDNYNMMGMSTPRRTTIRTPSSSSLLLSTTTTRLKQQSKANMDKIEMTMHVEKHDRDNDADNFDDDDDDDDDDALLTKDWQFCRLPYVGDATNATRKLPIWYQCAGPSYEYLADRLRDHAHRLRTLGIKPRTWGHRQHALPANSTVLIFGNSHARQLGHALACQHGASAVRSVVHFDVHLANPDMAVRVEFANNATLWIVANSYVAHSPYWDRLLAQQTRTTTSLTNAFDAVVLGRFNSGGAARMSAFATQMDQIQALLPETDAVDWQRRQGPTIEEMAAVYNHPSKPLVFATMFNGNLQHDEQHVLYLRQMQHRLDIIRRQRQGQDRSNNNNNLYLQDARAHIRAMQLEGMSNNRTTVGRAWNGLGAGHRCMGPRGGHPDLVAWDLTEFFHEHIPALS